MRPILSLVMIVKDEAKTIRKVLESVRDHVDRWTILDTGSTDGTQDIVRSVLSEQYGVLHEEPFVDFATTRNRALELDAMFVEPEDLPVFTLMLSGDEYLKDGDALEAYLETQRDTNVDCHLVRVSIDTATLLSPRILRTGSAWHYEGVVHEVPCNRAQNNAPIGTAPGLIEHVVSDPEKRFSNIWEVHIPLLRKELEKNPNDERALIFLAQSYESLFFGMEEEERIEFAKEAVNLYVRRLAIPTGNAVERNYVRMHCIDTMRITGMYSDAQLLEQAESLAKDDPQRPETALLCASLAMTVKPLPRVYELAAAAAKVASEACAIENSSPVDLSCIWRAHHLAAVAARQLSEKHPEEAARVDFKRLVREHVTAGLSAGGPWSLFKPITSPPASTP